MACCLAWGERRFSLLNLYRMASILWYSTSDLVFEATWQPSILRMNSHLSLLDQRVLKVIEDLEENGLFYMSCEREREGDMLFLKNLRVLPEVNRYRFLERLRKRRILSLDYSLGSVGVPVSGLLVHRGSPIYRQVLLALTPTKSTQDEWQKQQYSSLLIRTLPSPMISLCMGFLVHCTTTSPFLTTASSKSVGSVILFLKEKTKCLQMKGRDKSTVKTGSDSKRRSLMAFSLSWNWSSSNSCGEMKQKEVSGMAMQLLVLSTTWQGSLTSMILSLLLAAQHLLLGLFSILQMACSIYILPAFLAYLHNSTRILPFRRMYTPSRSRCAWLKCSARLQPSRRGGLSKKSERVREWGSRGELEAEASIFQVYSLQDCFLKRWSEEKRWN